VNCIEQLNRIRSSGGEVEWREGEVFLHFRSGLLTEEEVEALRCSEAELNELLRPERREATPCPFQWSGELLGPEAGLDCEATLIKGFGLPKLVLVSVWDGETTGDGWNRESVTIVCVGIAHKKLQCFSPNALQVSSCACSTHTIRGVVVGHAAEHS
jgi:hypothetical protein